MLLFCKDSIFLPYFFSLCCFSISGSKIIGVQKKIIRKIECVFHKFLQYICELIMVKLCQNIRRKSGKASLSIK